jgi:hypothetical protein
MHFGEHTTDKTTAKFYLRAIEETRPVIYKEGTLQVLEPGGPTGVFVEQIWARITRPDDRMFDVHELATAEHQQRYPQAWVAYLQGEAVTAETLPIEMFPLARPATVERLKRAGLATVGALAAASDDEIATLGPTADELRDRCRQWVRPVRKSEKDLLATITDLKAQLEQANAALDAARRARAA